MISKLLKRIKPLSELEFSLDQKRILIAKTTHIGDVVITLPMAGVIKYYYPDSQILFLAKGPGCDIAKRYAFIDEVYEQSIIDTEEGLKQCRADVFIQVNNSKRLADAAKKANISIRIGSIYQQYNWFSCTHLAVISRGYKKFNKRQLDLEYLKPLNISHLFSYEDLSFLYQFTKKPLTKWSLENTNVNKFKLILHPSLITAKKYQWPLEYYQQLIQSLDPEKFQIFITGVESDRTYLQPLLDDVKNNSNIIDVVGQMKIGELITFMACCDGLIAGSTGPLHLAAALGIHALGIYRADKTYIKRWEAVGIKAEVLAQQAPCSKCPSGDPCQCILSIKPDFVKARIMDWQMNRQIIV